ncbi:MAG: SAM-dependent methyltransferase [Polyangiales bacterium]
MEVGIEAIGHVRGGRSTRRDDGWDEETASIELHERFGVEAIASLESFSHIEVIFRFHTLSDEQVNTGARHPRGNTDWPLVGIFAQRGSKRPNRLGVTVCQLLGVEGRKIHVRGLDAIEGTPVLDVKPVMKEFLPRGEVRQPAWSSALMTGYWHGPDVANDD